MRTDQRWAMQYERDDLYRIMHGVLLISTAVCARELAA